MSLSNLPSPFAEIDELVERGELTQARSSLSATEQTPGNSAFIELLDVKLGLREASLRPQLAMNRLLSLMRADSKFSAAHDLYKEASELSYSERSSSLAHSHPPPPMKVK